MFAAAATLLVFGGTAQASDYYQIRLSAESGQCLSGGVAGFSQVEIFDCYLSTQWISKNPTEVGGYVYYQMQDRQTGYCLGVSGASSANGAPLAVGNCSPTSDHSQLWRASFVDSAYVRYLLVNAHSGKCAGTKGKATVSDTPVVQGACSTSPGGTQIWYAHTPVS
jgi:hypothetical protein